MHLIPHRILQNTERTYHCIIMHFFKKEKRKQSIIKLNKQSINVTLIDFRNKNIFRSCIMKWKWTTVSCFRRFVSRDKISHYFDRFICQRLYYDAEMHEWTQEIWSKNVIFKCKNYVPHLLFHVQIIFFRNSFFRHLNKALTI